MTDFTPSFGDIVSIVGFISLFIGLARKMGITKAVHTSDISYLREKMTTVFHFINKTRPQVEVMSEQVTRLERNKKELWDRTRAIEVTITEIKTTLSVLTEKSSNMGFAIKSVHNDVKEIAKMLKK